MLRSLRVLHVTKRFWPHVGGVERYVLDLAGAQVQNGRSCRVLTIDRDLLLRGGPHLPAIDVRDGIRIHRVRAIGGSRKQLLAEPPGRVLRLLRWADVIHHHDPRFLFETVVLTRPVLRRPVIFHTHGMILHTPAHRRLKKVAMRAYYGPILAHAVDAVIADSQGDLEMMRAYSGLGSDTVRVFENALSLTRYRSIVRHPEPGRILCFGRIDAHKGLSSLLEAVSRIERPWRLDVVGIGPAEQMDALRQQAEHLGVSGRVRWMGGVSDLELDALLERASVAVFPSQFEGFGIALVEALAAGCLVVANDIPTHREILGDALAEWLTDFGGPEAAAAIERALAIGGMEASRLEGEARARAGEFSIDRLHGQIDRLYEELGVTGQRAAEDASGA